MSKPPQMAILSAILRGFLLERFSIRMGNDPGNDAERFERLDRYIRDELGPSMRIRVERVESMGRGTNPVVRRVVDSSGGGHVARCFARRLPGKDKSREHAEVSRLLDRAGVIVPRVEHCDSTYLTLGRHGFEVVVEEWIEGRHPSADDLGSADSEILESIAKVVAALHSLQARRSGTPWRRRGRGRDFIRETFVARCEEALSLIERSDPTGSDSSSIAAVRGHLAERQATLDPGPPYSLVHGDVQAGNLVVPSGGAGAVSGTPRIVLIDFGTVHYGLWPWDIVGFHNGCARREIEITRRFAKAYLKSRPEADPERLRRAWDYLHPFYHVEKCAAALRKYRRAREGKRSDRAPEALLRRASDQWRLAVEAVRAGLSPL
ncbi:aminoglycoside phosphotransferase family protein [Candidatus Sumerlaeota bacterium]|nr:aminoglycoside phosphotransferase family protein [Candidatus Sumerlaeota bacterium]